MHHACAVFGAHIVCQIHRGKALVARVHTVERVAEVKTAQFLALGGGNHAALQLVAFQTFFYQRLGQHQVAAWGIDQRVIQLGVGV